MNAIIRFGAAVVSAALLAGPLLAQSTASWPPNELSTNTPPAETPRNGPFAPPPVTPPSGQVPAAPVPPSAVVTNPVTINIFPGGGRQGDASVNVTTGSVKRVEPAPVRTIPPPQP